MATNDLITTADAKTALNISVSTFDTEIASYITAISQRLDDLCGPIVLRTYTDEQYPGGTHCIPLRHAPASDTAASTITTVKEYSSGTLTTLAAETVTVSTVDDFYFEQKTGLLYRRSGWSDALFAAQRVLVTYNGGRYANTAAVDEKFKAAARTFLQHLWRPEQGTSSVMFPSDVPVADVGIPGFGVPNLVKDMLVNEVQQQALAGFA